MTHATLPDQHPAPRRTRRALALAATAWCMALSALPLHAATGVPRAAPSTWTEEGHDGSAMSLNPAETTLKAGVLPQLKVLWSRNLDVWDQSTSLTQSDGQAFVGRKVSDPFTTVKSQLLRLDPATGKTVWQVDTHDFFPPPTLVSDLAIVAGSEDGSGVAVPITAYARDTGAKRWEWRLPSGAGSATFTAPHAANGAVFAVSIGGHAVALDAATGVPRWEVQSGTTESHPGLALADGRVFVLGWSRLIAHDATDGHVLWQFDAPVSTLLTVRPMVVGSTVLLYDSAGTLHALDAATGTPKWDSVTPQGDLADGSTELASDGQRVFALNGVSRKHLSAIDLASGQVLWSDRTNLFARSMVVANGVLFYATKQVVARDPATGAALPIAKLKLSRFAEFIVVDGQLLIDAGPVQAVGLPPAR